MIIYIWNLKINTNEFMYETNTDSRTANEWFQRRKGEEEGQVRSIVQTTTGEGKGNPLQYSCLENPVDRGAWRATVHRVTKEPGTT